jgi:hypothetical protein
MRAILNGAAYLDAVQNGHDKDIQAGIPPPNHDAREIRSREVRRPKDAHQPIMLWHDQQTRPRKIPSSSAVRARICRSRGFVGAKGGRDKSVDQESRNGAPERKWSRVAKSRSYQGCFPCCQTFHGNENEDEEERQYAETFGGA